MIEALRYFIFVGEKIKNNFMQQQNRLPITGMSHTLPPAMCEDGECSRIVNMRCENDVWKPVGNPRLIYTPDDPSRKNYIFAL